MDYLTKLVNYYQENFDKVVKGISSHSDFSEEDAEDVVQDGMVKALVAIENGHTLDDIEAFFMRHVTQARINHYNRYIMQKPEVEGQEEPEWEDSGNFLEELGHFDLTPNQLKVVCLKRKGYVNKEISDFIGVSSRQIKNFFRQLSQKSSTGGRIGPLSSI